MLKYVHTGEHDWLQYHKRHKNMSESTFVQAFLTHLSRVSVYPALGKVRVMISSRNLGEGIVLTLHNLAQLVALTNEAVPDYVVVLAVRPNVGVEFCVLVLEPLQAQLLLLQMQRGKKGRGRGAGSTQAPPTHPPPQIKISRERLLSLRSYQRRLQGSVHVPFRQQNGDERMTVPVSEAEGEIPGVPHVIEHRPGGPFQCQYQVAMHLLQRLCEGGGGEGGGGKIEEFRDLDFSVLCPSDVGVARELERSVARSGLVQCVMEWEEEGEGGRGEGGEEEEEVMAEVRRRVIRCSAGDWGKFADLISRVKATPTKLFLVVSEQADLTCSLAEVGGGSHAPSVGGASSETTPTTRYGENKGLLSQPNVVVLYVSSHPYRLLSNRSLVAPGNEVFWPTEVEEPTGGGGGGLEFCQLGGQVGVEVREDVCLEEEFHRLCVEQR